MNPAVIEKIKSAPKRPGVYLFYRNKTLLYIGKAANLRARLKSYLKIIDVKTQSLHEEATRLEYIPMRSEIEALIEESRLIQKLKPKYNIVWQDDKSYLYVYFTKEPFPKIFIGHDSRFTLSRHHLNNFSEGGIPPTAGQDSSRIGPFTDGNALRTVMKLLRRYFPYCTCLRPHLRDCLNAQIDKCLGYCCKKSGLVIASKAKQSYNSASVRSPRSENGARDDDGKIYMKNIKMIKKILSGRKTLKNITEEKERRALEKIFEHREFLHDENTKTYESTKTGGAIFRNFVDFRTFVRVECYDNSHLAGKEAVGAMTVLKKVELENRKWEFIPDKNSYRKFKIKSLPAGRQARQGIDDPRAIAEILERRLNHPEWPYPDLIIIDGGLTQFRAAKKISSQFLIPDSQFPKLISFAKPQKLVYGLKPNDEPTPLSELPEEFQKLIGQAIYQTHNFVIRYHRSVRNREFLL